MFKFFYPKGVVLLILCKLLDGIDWSWLWVLSPIWGLLLITAIHLGLMSSNYRYFKFVMWITDDTY